MTKFLVTNELMGMDYVTKVCLFGVFLKSTTIRNPVFLPEGAEDEKGTNWSSKPHGRALMTSFTSFSRH